MLNELLKFLQPYVYNVAIRMVLNLEDSEDISQDVLVKIVLKLSQYDFNKSKLTTWVYAIVRNQVINMSKKLMEKIIGTFTDYGNNLDVIPNQNIEKGEFNNPETQILIKEANVGCMLGMLLCLDREQRFIYTLGEILKVEHKLASQTCNITPDNYRKKLSRAKKILYTFMDESVVWLKKRTGVGAIKKQRTLFRLAG